MAKGTVVLYSSRLGMPLYAHERKALAVVAMAIAGVKGYAYGGPYDTGHHRFDNIFFVPDDTLMRDEALAVGIHGPEDFFGGVVPHAFVKTKAISHPLIDNSAEQPEGWSTEFAERVQEHVLPGYTAFTVRDARVAATHLRRHGPIRAKKPRGAGGRGQRIVNNTGELDQFLGAVSPEDLTLCGVVLETQLRRVTTLSVGEVTVGNLAITYVGRQRLARDNAGRMVYGGSHLSCVRGGWDALEKLSLPVNVQIAVNQARGYDRSMSAYPGFMASRRNYDVGQGIDADGEWRSGVLEASWRIGGASTAELAAMTAFVQDPLLEVVDACVVKEFGRGHEVPRDAVVHYQGDDPEDGPITRYVRVTRTTL